MVGMHPILLFMKVIKQINNSLFFRLNIHKKFRSFNAKIEKSYSKELVCSTFRLIVFCYSYNFL